MKKFKVLFFYLLSMLISTVGFANPSVEKIRAFEIGLGAQSNFGSLGGSFRSFISENQDIHVDAGLDLPGPIIGIGSRFYLHPSTEKCFFVLDCNARYSIGLAVSQTLGMSVMRKDDSSLYKFSDGYATNLTIGSYDTFNNSFSLGIEIGYGAWIKKPTLTHQSGAYSENIKNDFEEDIKKSLNLAATFGWLF